MEPTRPAPQTDAGPPAVAEPRHNLVGALTSFVGREREVADVAERLSSTRLLTLTGPGGIGKTRLALQVGAEVVPRYRDGVWLVELAPLADAALIPRAITSALGTYEDPSRPILATVADALRPRRSLLLILDNCEHLVDAVAAIVDQLLRDCSDLTILATSREALGVVGEVVRQVPPLSVPDDTAFAPSAGDVVAGLGEHEATRLFVERAGAVSDRLAVTEQHAPAIAQICRRLDGIPLAIELAAARSRVLTPQQIAARLDDRFRLLTDGSRTALPRQRTLRAAIDWSYDLLAESERLMLQRLAIFAGGWTLEAAEAVTSAGHDTLDLLSRLVDKSLVTVDLTGDEARHGLLETVRQYALERSEEGGEAPAARRRHAAYFLALAERAEPELHGPDQANWLDRLAAEHDNFRAAFGWTLGDGNAPVVALRLAGALRWFWFVRSLLGETRWLEAALAATDGPTADVGTIRARAKALRHLGWIARFWNDPPRAVALGEQSLALSRAIGDRPADAYTLTILGMLLRDLRDYPRARAAAEAGIALGRETGDLRATAHGLYVLASVMFHERHAPALETSGATSDRDGETSRREQPEARAPFDGPPPTWLDLEPAPMDLRAVELLEESLALSRRFGDLWGVAVALTGGGGLMAHTLVGGDLDRAVAACTESLARYWHLRDLRNVSVVLRGFGRIALSQGEPLRAARLIAVFRRQYESTGMILPLPLTVWPGVEPEIAALRSRLRLDDDAFAAVWEQGRAMSLDQAVEYALRRSDPFGDDVAPAAPLAPVRSPAARAPSALTPREREVAILVGRGYSNRRIAEQLVIAEKTAEVHARNVREKLGLSSRAQIAAWAARHGLLPTDENE